MPVLRPVASDFTAAVKATANLRQLAAKPNGSFIPSKSSVAVLNISQLSALVTSAKFSAFKPVVVPPVSLTNAGNNDVFVVKYDGSGLVQWAARIAGSGEDIGTDIVTDSSGNIYVTGYYASSPVTIYNANNTTFGTLVNTALRDGFIVKYNTNGIVQWTTRIGGSSTEYVNGISVDSSGNIYAIGFYGAGTIYNADGTTFGTLANSGGGDVFVVKYNSSGTAQWATRIDGTLREYGNDIAVDSTGNVYVTGQYESNPLTIYNADTSSFGTLTRSGTNDVFIVKYNTNGTAQWAARVGGTGEDGGYGICVDSSSNVYVTGYYITNSLTIYNANGTTFGTLANSGVADVFVVKYNSSGAAQWATRLCGTDNDYGYNIAADSNGNVYVTGYYGFASLTIYNADTTTFTTLPTASQRDCFIVKYNTNGTGQWATRLSGSGTDWGNGVCVDSSNNVYITGYFENSQLIVYNTNASVFTRVNNSGGADAFVVKYDTNGTPQWVNRIGGITHDIGYGITVDLSGNVSVTGKYLSNPLTFYTQGQ